MPDMIKTLFRRIGSPGNSNQAILGSSYFTDLTCILLNMAGYYSMVFLLGFAEIPGDGRPSLLGLIFQYFLASLIASLFIQYLFSGLIYLFARNRSPHIIHKEVRILTGTSFLLPLTMATPLTLLLWVLGPTILPEKETYITVLANAFGLIVFFGLSLWGLIVNIQSLAKLLNVSVARASSIVLFTGFLLLSLPILLYMATVLGLDS